MTRDESIYIDDYGSQTPSEWHMTSNSREWFDDSDDAARRPSRQALPPELVVQLREAVLAGELAEDSVPEVINQLEAFMVYRRSESERVLRVSMGVVVVLLTATVLVATSVSSKDKVAVAVATSGVLLLSALLTTLLAMSFAGNYVKSRLRVSEQARRNDDLRREILQRVAQRLRTDAKQEA